MAPANGIRVASSAKIRATSVWPTAATGHSQMLAGPRWVMAKPKFRKMPVVMEMIENATEKTANRQSTRLSSWRYPNSLTAASSVPDAIWFADMAPASRLRRPGPVPGLPRHLRETAWDVRAKLVKRLGQLT